MTSPSSSSDLPSSSTSLFAPVVSSPPAEISSAPRRCPSWDNYIKIRPNSETHLFEVFEIVFGGVKGLAPKRMPEPLASFALASVAKAYRKALVASLQEGTRPYVSLLFAEARAKIEEESPEKTYTEEPDEHFIE